MEKLVKKTTNIALTFRGNSCIIKNTQEWEKLEKFLCKIGD